MTHEETDRSVRAGWERDAPEPMLQSELSGAERRLINASRVDRGKSNSRNTSAALSYCLYSPCDDRCVKPHECTPVQDFSAEPETGELSRNEQRFITAVRAHVTDLQSVIASLCLVLYA